MGFLWIGIFTHFSRQWERYEGEEANRETEIETCTGDDRVDLVPYR